MSVRSVLIVGILLAHQPTDVSFAQSAEQGSTDWRTLLATDGAEIRYLDRGEGEPALVFVHGWVGAATDWSAQLDALSVGHRTIAIELGAREPLAAARREWSIARLASDVVEVVEAEKIRSLILIGHELGGLIIAETAVQLDGRVVGLIGIETFVHVRNPMSRSQQRSILNALNDDFVGAVRDFVTDLMPPDTEQSTLTRVVVRATTLEATAARQLLRDAFAYDLGARLARIPQPVAALNSAQNAPVADALLAVHADFRTVITSDLDPYPFMSAPNELNELLREQIRAMTDAAARQPAKPVDRDGSL